mmetsp:Transcript_22190/g.52182  ORF Transcript_22190/g.52182 Transcript_22190/m.52182 type:complete len:423 (+) Transcript_22190:231-1499(+)
MCRPTTASLTANNGGEVMKKSDSSSSSTKTSSTGGLSKCTTIVGGLFASMVVVFPMIVSELIGGWTTKYTPPSVFNFSSETEIQDLSGKVAIVTGANTGIGYHTALELARQNCHVIVASRSSTKGQAAVDKIINEISAPGQEEEEHAKNVEFLQLDLSSLGSVQEFVKDFKASSAEPKSLDMLVLNAGIMKSPGSQYIGQNLTYGYDTTSEGFEAHIGVNHIGHYYLTRLLLDDFIVPSQTRVVAVSSAAEEGAYMPEGMKFETWKPESKEHAFEMGYEDGNAYGQSKLANILFAKELAARYSTEGVTAYSCHPGVIKSELSRYMVENTEKELESASWFAKMATQLFGQYFELAMMDTPDGALTQLHLATSPRDEIVNGGFYHPVGRLMKDGPKHPQGSNETLQQFVWTETERMILEAGYTF